MRLIRLPIYFYCWWQHSMWTIDKHHLSMLAYVLSLAPRQDPIEQPNTYVRKSMSNSSLIAHRRHLRSRGGRPYTTIRGGWHLLARMASTWRLHGPEPYPRLRPRKRIAASGGFTVSSFPQLRTLVRMVYLSRGWEKFFWMPSCGPPSFANFILESASLNHDGFWSNDMKCFWSNAMSRMSLPGWQYSHNWRARWMVARRTLVRWRSFDQVPCNSMPGILSANPDSSRHLRHPW